ncbi:hypothetical protein DFJ74DRAFT_768427 [Hyaloraphidium curvatum]|nr:hypothetical protein DFJ74DRAFT_768427 [Hyaloraphidium curvatum]
MENGNPFNLPPAFFPEPGSDGAVPSFGDHLAAARRYASSLAAFTAEVVPLDNAALLAAHPADFLMYGRDEAWKGALGVMKAAGRERDDASDLLAGTDDMPAMSAELETLSSWFSRARELAMPRIPAETTTVSTWDDPSNRPDPLYTSRKKSHELDLLVDRIGSVAAKSQLGKVVDAGAGAGRLGTVLTARFGLDVVGIERNSDTPDRTGLRTRLAARALLELVHAELHEAGRPCAACGGEGGGLPRGTHSRYKPGRPFAEYAREALGPGLELDGLDKRFDSVRKEEAPAMGVFGAMRHALGAVAESLIILDRALFLVEEAERHGERVDVQVVPLFDPGVSPRNLVLVARKIDATS